jgi:hypothetical protein
MILNLRKIMQWTRFIERKTTFNENYGTCRQIHLMRNSSMQKKPTAKCPAKDILLVLMYVFRLRAC